MESKENPIEQLDLGIWKVGTDYKITQRTELCKKCESEAYEGLVALFVYKEFEKPLPTP